MSTAAKSAPPAKPPTRWKTAAVLIVIAGITVWSAFGVHVDFAAIVDNWNNASATIASLLQPDYWFIPGTGQAVLETVQMAVIATAVSAAISLPVAFLASRSTNPNNSLLAAVRFIMNIVRSVPDLLYAAVLVSVVGTGAISGIFALILFDFGIIVKLVSEAIDGLDVGPQEAALSAGGSWFKADRVAMLPQVMPSFTSQVLYTFELNIRASTVIGLVGAGGLGMLIDRVRTFYRYHDLSLIILEILVIVVVIEFASSLLRKRLAR
ncbi:phosphonate ABC transporter, permease protein PhnE [Spelaeicoccus albus]|uniref:Phosphonate transport system permease protein n=1 Tax=Spelaeicoccus albus TaxID=1280376 RepID=A0A7Z0D0U8_9MICO|nr:phosphonate ABC transporter, permease protein PhnE [Spelaeicoccus albus]NYI65873.1 phosphonate transport system permease protein [Spelaeicoccus albus]